MSLAASSEISLVEQPSSAVTALGDRRMRASKRRALRLDRQLYAPLLYLSVVGSLVCLFLALPSAMAGNAGFPFAVMTLALTGHIASFGLVAMLGRVREGTLLGVVVFTLLLSWATAQTGGLFSPLLLLFVLAPIEALLAERARCSMQVALVTFFGFAIVAIATFTAPQEGLLSQGQLVVMAMFGLLYALSLAARIVRVGSLKDMRAQAARRAIEQFHTVTHDLFLLIERDGAVEQAFGAVQSILGCSSSALRDTGFMHRLHVSDRPSVLTTLDRVHTSGGRDSVEARLRVGADDAPQHFIWVEIDLSMMRRADGTHDVYALVRDISARKQRASQLELAREKAEASDAAKGRFLATMSHELRTPLNAIIGFADILDEEVFGAMANDQQREYVGLIRDSGGHLLQLVNDLLDMSKLDAGHFQIVAEPFVLRTVADRCSRLVGQQFVNGELTLVTDIPANLPELVADQRAIRQVLINLLSNAAKFTPSGGTITLRARKDGDTLVLSVTDTGIGIAASDIGRIGEPFFQANNAYDRNHQGTGLGLSVVKGLCELHDGAFSVTSVEGEGTTVTVRLPFAGPDRGGKTRDLAVDQQMANTVVMAKLNTATRTVSAPAPERTASVPKQAVPLDLPEEGRRAHG